MILGLAMPAYGSDGRPAVVGGTSRVSSFETHASSIATSLAGRPVSIDCVDTDEWRSLSAHYGFDRSLTWALTPLVDGDSGLVVHARSASFSPRTCRLAAAFRANPRERGTRVCRHGTTTVRLTVPGVGGRRPRTARARVPLLGECDGWAAKLLAVHVLGHESMHLAGVVDEAEAECLATQLGAFVASSLGASTGFARSLAGEYWAYYYRSQDRRYLSSECRDGGVLDLFPRRRGWPSPRSYPTHLARAIESFTSRA
jgi:hypothetical protein